MKEFFSFHQAAASALLLDTALPRLEDSLDELGAWRETDLRRDEDRPDSPAHLLSGLQLIFKVAQTASLAAAHDDADQEQKRLLDELTALRLTFAPKAEIQATLRKLATCRKIAQTQDDEVDQEEVMVEAGQLFDELAGRYHRTHASRGVCSTAVN